MPSHGSFLVRLHVRYLARTHNHLGNHAQRRAQANGANGAQDRQGDPDRALHLRRNSKISRALRFLLHRQVRILGIQQFERHRRRGRKVVLRGEGKRVIAAEVRRRLDPFIWR